MEKFKDVPGFELEYEVSNLGRIRNKERGNILVPHQNKNNFIWSVKLFKNGVPKTMACGRIVAMAWVYNPNPMLFNYAINMDGNFNDYTASNMMWGSNSIREKRTIKRTGKQNMSHGNPKVSKTLDVEMEKQLVEMRARGAKMDDILKSFPVKKSTAWKIISKYKKVDNK